MQINDEIEFFGFQLPKQLRRFVFPKPDFIDMRIGFYQAPECRFGEKMDCCVRITGFERAHHRRGKDNVANGTKTDNKKARHGDKTTWIFQVLFPSFEFCTFAA